MREQARLAKDWGLADAVRERLTAAGVTLFDKTNAWRTSDGRSGRIPTWSEIEAGHTAESIIQQTDDKTVPFPAGDSTEAQIKYMVQMREQARAAKDWAQSDKLRDELKAMGVEVFDKDKMWRSKTGLSGVIIGFRGSAGPTDMEISVLVVQRERARQSSDFSTADMIRDELKKVGVDINDKEKCWRASDGRVGAIPSWASIIGSTDGPSPSPVVNAAAYAAPTNSSPGVGGDLRNQIIQAALVNAQNPVTAARTLQLLQQAAGGAAPSSGPSKPKPTQAVLPTASRPNADLSEALSFANQCQASGRHASDGEITWLIEIREKLRQNKEFANADEVRNALRNSLGVELYEKEKRWITNDGRQGSIPMWSTLSV